jgi:hypothetical protein
MWLLRFLFTGRRGFILFALLAFVATLAYLGWYHRYRAPVILQQQQGGERLRQMHRDSDKAIRAYPGPSIPPPKNPDQKGQQQ